MSSTFQQQQVSAERASSVNRVDLPRRQQSYASPADWRDEIIYFLLPDRFSDGQEQTRPLLDPANRLTARPPGFQWNNWAESGGARWQGGTIAGVASKLSYLAQLGVTVVWLGPVFKQRAPDDSYHGYAIQDFLEVDRRFGTGAELVDLVSARTGPARHPRCHLRPYQEQFVYEGDVNKPPYRPWPG